MGALNELRDRWTKEAEDLRSRYGREDLARLCEVHAQELMAAEELVKDEIWTVGRAATETGYSTTHLYQLIEQGHLRDVGTGGQVRLLAAEIWSRVGQKRARKLPESSPENPWLKRKDLSLVSKR
jgi:hypothetical protein